MIKFLVKVDIIFAYTILIITFASQFKANHNKDYSVVKTYKAGQLAFFYLS